MRKTKYFVADAFTDHVFGGGPAGVVFTDEWLPDALMQNIAMENNLADTAFVVRGESGWELRWFMPDGEIDLNGHATLAAAHCLFTYLEPQLDSVAFNTKSGVLCATREGGLIALDMPAVFNEPIPVDDALVAALGGARPAEALFGQNYLCVFQTAEEVRSLQPDFNAMGVLPKGDGVFVTAPGDGGCDIVARAFWPKMGVNEDPVCGNMHCNLAPFWSERLGKTEIVSHQLSRRGATVVCEARGARVKLKGTAALFLQTELEL